MIPEKLADQAYESLRNKRESLVCRMTLPTGEATLCLGEACAWWVVFVGKL